MKVSFVFSLVVKKQTTTDLQKGALIDIRRTTVMIGCPFYLIIFRILLIVLLT